MKNDNEHYQMVLGGRLAVAGVGLAGVVEPVLQLTGHDDGVGHTTEVGGVHCLGTGGEN